MGRQGGRGRKPRRIDPSTYPDKRRLRADSSPSGRGSKWLKDVSPDAEFEIVRQVLEQHRVRVGDPKRTLRSDPQPISVGVSNGEFVQSVEVKFDGRNAHGYPCLP